MAAYGANLLRSGLQGLTFNTSDEVEAFLRSLGGGDYRTIKNDINADYKRWQEENPLTSFGAETAGMVIPGLVGALIPGGQGATAATVGRLGRVMAEPLTVATRRFLPGVLERGGRLVQGGVRGGLGILDELLTGAVQSAGQAERPEDIMPTVDEALMGNFGGALGVRALNKMGKKAIALPLLLASQDAMARQPPALAVRRPQPTALHALTRVPATPPMLAAPVAVRRRQPMPLDALVGVPAPPPMLAVRRPQEFR